MRLTEKQKQIRDLVRHVARERVAPHAVLVDEEERFPIESFDAFKEHGLLTISLPERFGGLEADTTSLSLAIQEIAKVCGSSSLVVFPTQAVIKSIMQAGNEEQIERFGRIFSSGDKLAAFCLSEPNYGSDAGSIQTRAVLDGDDYVLNGTKAWITLGSAADYYLVFVRTGPGARTSGISAFMVDKNTPGVSFGHPEHKMGLRGSLTTEMSFLNARVPRANLIMGEARGWELLTEVCNNMRVWGAASMALGLAEGAYEEALSFAKNKVQFGRIIGRQQSIQFMLADMKMKIEAVRSLILRTTDAIDHGDESPKDIATLVSASKCLASDVAMEVTDKAVQVCASHGIRKGANVERMMRDAKAIQIFDGSNQIQRLIVGGNILVN